MKLYQISLIFEIGIREVVFDRIDEKCINRINLQCCIYSRWRRTIEC